MSRIGFIIVQGETPDPGCSWRCIKSFTGGRRFSDGRCPPAPRKHSAKLSPEFAHPPFGRNDRATHLSDPSGELENCAEIADICHRALQWHRSSPSLLNPYLIPAARAAARTWRLLCFGLEGRKAGSRIRLSPFTRADGARQDLSLAPYRLMRAWHGCVTPEPAPDAARAVVTPGQQTHSLGSCRLCAAFTLSMGRLRKGRGCGRGCLSE